jgi:hypothetical protein
MRGGDGRTPLRCHLARRPPTKHHHLVCCGLMKRMDLEQTVDALVYRKKALDLDSPERKFINRILTGPALLL